MNYKAKISPDALTTHGSQARQSFTVRKAVKFSMDTGQTVLMVSGKRCVGNTVGVGMQLGNTSRVGMPKVVMPDDMKQVACQVVKCEAITRWEMR